MKTTDLIVKHLNVLISKYQLEMDLLSEMKKKPTNELHQAEIDINIAYFEEEIKEIKEVLEVLEREKKNYTLIPMGDLSEVKSIRINPFKYTSDKEELIKDAETLLTEFKKANDDSAKFEVEQKVTGPFFNKHYDSFPLFCVIFSRTVSSYYSIEVTEKFLEFLGQLEYEEASNKIDLWIGDNNPKKVKI